MSARDNWKTLTKSHGTLSLWSHGEKVFYEVYTNYERRQKLFEKINTMSCDFEECFILIQPDYTYENNFAVNEREQRNKTN